MRVTAAGRHGPPPTPGRPATSRALRDVVPRRRLQRSPTRPRRLQRSPAPTPRPRSNPTPRRRQRAGGGAAAVLGLPGATPAPRAQPALMRSPSRWARRPVVLDLQNPKPSAWLLRARQSRPPPPTRCAYHLVCLVVPLRVRDEEGLALVEDKVIQDRVHIELRRRAGSSRSSARPRGVSPPGVRRWCTPCPPAHPVPQHALCSPPAFARSAAMPVAALAGPGATLEGRCTCQHRHTCSATPLVHFPGPTARQQPHHGPRDTIEVCN